MKDFFSLKRLGLSFVIFLGTGFIVFVVVQSVTDVPAGPGSFAAGVALLFAALIVFVIAFPAVRFFAGKYYLSEKSSKAWSYAFWELILFSAIIVAGFYAYGGLDNYWQETYSERAAEEIVYEATLRQGESHCDSIPRTQEEFKNACHAVFDNKMEICKKAMSQDECRQNVILANAVTPRCESEKDKGCGYAADRAIWARAIRDRDRNMCKQITDDAFQKRCQNTLEETQQLYAGTVKECTQTAKEIGSESGGYYECIVGTAMYQNKPEQCNQATKENIYPGLSDDLKQFEYYKMDRLYENLRETCRKQLSKEIDIEYGRGYTATTRARNFYSIPDRVDSIFSAVVFGG